MKYTLFSKVTASLSLLRILKDFVALFLAKQLSSSDQPVVANKFSWQYRLSAGPIKARKGKVG